MGESLGEWIEKNGFKKLESDIQIHCEQYLDDPNIALVVDEAKDLTRNIMISVRQEMELRNDKKR